MICRSRYCIPNRWFLETNVILDYNNAEWSLWEIDNDVVWWTPFWQGSFTKVLKIIHGWWFWVVRMGGTLHPLTTEWLLVAVCQGSQGTKVALLVENKGSSHNKKTLNLIPLVYVIHWTGRCYYIKHKSNYIYIYPYLYKFWVYVLDLPSNQSFCSQQKRFWTKLPKLLQPPFWINHLTPLLAEKKASAYPSFPTKHMENLETFSTWKT